MGHLFAQEWGGLSELLGQHHVVPDLVVVVENKT